MVSIPCALQSNHKKDTNCPSSKYHNSSRNIKCPKTQIAILLYTADDAIMHATHSNSPIGLNPSSQTHPMRTGFVGDVNVVLLWDRVVVPRASKADDRSSVMLNQFSSPSRGDSLNSKEVVGDVLDSPKMSSPLSNDVSVDTNGRNVTGNRCCSSKV
jgi:hypothetical protein